MTKYFHNNQNGQSIIEIIVALAIFSLVSSTLVSLLLGGVGVFSGMEKKSAVAFALAEDAEAVRSIAHSAWGDISPGEKAIVGGGQWSLTDELPVEGDLIRTVNFMPVFRDASGAITVFDDPSAILDPFSYEVSVLVKWTRADNQEDSLESRFLVAPSDFVIHEDNDWSDPSEYFASAGVDTEIGITLAEVATSTFETVGSLESLPFQLPIRGNFLALEWDGDTPEGDVVRIRIKMSANNIDWSSTWCGPDGEDDGDEEDFFSAQTPTMIHGSHNGDQWLKYKVDLTGSGSTTPTVNNLGIRWQ